jgi:hypothetical protein
MTHGWFRPALVGVLCVAACAGAVAAQTTASTEQRAVALARADRWLAAAEAWSDVAIAVAGTSVTAKRQSAHALVCAAIAWERGQSARAYAAWSDALRLFLESGTTWPAERARLTAAMQDLDRALRLAAPGSGQLVGTSDGEFTTLERYQVLDVGVFDGPRPGLWDALPEAGPQGLEAPAGPDATEPASAGPLVVGADVAPLGRPGWSAEGRPADARSSSAVLALLDSAATWPNLDLDLFTVGIPPFPPASTVSEDVRCATDDRECIALAFDSRCRATGECQ